MFGLLSAQIIATIQVYLSNIDLHHTLLVIRDAGYLTVPNQRTMHSLRALGSAVFGGLFFTFSVGAGLSAVAIGAAWVWDRLFSRNHLFLIGLGLLWLGCIVAVNRRGLCPAASSYYLVIPPGVFYAALRWLPARSMQMNRSSRMVHVVPVVLLTLIWIPQVDSHTFLDLRDYLLLSNPLGRRINAFYYDYTLYAAEVFKSLNQKMLKTCNLESIQSRSFAARLERELLNHDYLPIGEEGAVDLKVVPAGNMLDFRNRGRTILRTKAGVFFADPATVLKEFSTKSDRHGFFRLFTFFSLLLGLPVALYMILHGWFRFVSSFFLGPAASAVAASLLCLFAGITILIPLIQVRGISREVKPVCETLESESWQTRVAALRLVERQSMEVGNSHAYQRLLTSPHIAERYWLVRALGASRESATYRDLLAFLDDPHPNVVCMAFYALGRRGDRRAAGKILNRIQTSADWYTQWYGYKALRALGWKQTRSR